VPITNVSDNYLNTNKELARAPQSPLFNSMDRVFVEKLIID
jgi:hypothetical protein